MTFNRQPDEFLNSIYASTLIFRNQDIENKFIEENLKFDPNKKIAILSTYSASGLIMLRLIYLYFKYTIFENPLQKNPIHYLFGFIIGTIGIILDASFTRFRICPKILGFSYCAPLCILGSFMSYSENIVTLNESPYFSPLYFVFILILVTQAFLFCYNWISGAILLSIMFLSNITYIIIFPWSILDKLFILFEFSFAFLSICTALRFYEFSKRNNFFQTNQIKIQKEYTHLILNNIPESVVATEKGNVIFENKAFKELCEDPESQVNTFRAPIENSFENCNNERKAAFEATASKFLKNKTQETLHDYILSSKEVGIEKDFTFQRSALSKPTSYRIDSSDIKIENSKLIVYSLNNMESYNELREMKLKQKYSKLFVDAISHEFRTNIHIINGNSELISSTHSKKEFQSSLENIKIAARFLEILTQHLIDFSLLKGCQFKLNLNTFSISNILKEIINLFIKKFEDKNVVLKLTIDNNVPSFISSDQNRVIQVITNILSNSWKFTIKGEVHIYVTISNPLKLVYLRITDSGIGIKQEDVGKLMKPFTKLEDPYHLNDNGIII